MGRTRYCRMISAAMAVGPAKQPTPAWPKTFIRALSSNSPANDAVARVVRARQTLVQKAS